MGPLQPDWGPKSILKPVSVLQGPRHITKRCLSTQHLISFLIFCLGPPGKAQVLSISEYNCPLRAYQRFFVLVPRHVQGPNTAPQRARHRYHSEPFGTVGPMETLFRQLEVLSEPPGYQSNLMSN
jgi:hypothetical protein